MAILEKVKPLPWERVTCKEEEPAKSIDRIEDRKDFSLEDETEKGYHNIEKRNRLQALKRRRKRLAGFREDPFVYFKDEKDDAWVSIKYA